MKGAKRPHDDMILCGAKTRAGTPCQQKAGWGTDHVGEGRCKLHGGMSKGVKKNNNAEKHGLFSKYLPQETMDLVNNMESLNNIDILWDNIKIQYAAIIRSQQIMYVKDREDDDIHVIEKTVIGETPKKDEITVNKLQVITANERQSNFLQSQSRAMTTLSKMIRDYEELCESSLATEYQKLRIEKLKVDIDKVKENDSDKPIAIRLVTKGDTNGAD